VQTACRAAAAVEATQVSRVGRIAAAIVAHVTIFRSAIIWAARAAARRARSAQRGRVVRSQ
jgi:hypothetical protein